MGAAKIAEIMFFVQEAILSARVLTPYVIQTGIPMDFPTAINHLVREWNNKSN